MKKTVLITAALIIAVFAASAEKLTTDRAVEPFIAKNSTGFSIENGMTVYRGEGITTAIKMLNPEEEALFIKLNTGKDINIFLTDKQPRAFELFLLKITNHSEEKVIFNPGFAHLISKKSRGYIKDFTSLYSFFNETAPDSFRDIERILQTLVYDRNETLLPGESVNKFLVFSPVSENRTKFLAVDLSWLYIGQENLHLQFPYRIIYKKK